MEIVTQRFPCRGIVVEEVGEQVTAGLGYRRIIFGHKVFHHGEGNGIATSCTIARRTRLPCRTTTSDTATPPELHP